MLTQPWDENAAPNAMLSLVSRGNAENPQGMIPYDQLRPMERVFRMVEPIVIS